MLPQEAKRARLHLGAPRTHRQREQLVLRLLALGIRRSSRGLVPSRAEDGVEGGHAACVRYSRDYLRFFIIIWWQGVG